MQLSLYEQHKSRWNGCTKCELHQTRNRMVFAKGTVPCQILICGEGPGHSEDSLGVPFKGPAGQLLDKIIQRSIPINVPYAVTNLVCCIPKTEEGDKVHEPPDAAIKACSERLLDFFRVCDQGDTLKLIVCVGGVARDWLDPKWKGSIKLPKKLPIVDITHPAAILRRNLAQQSLDVQRAIITIATAIEEYQNGNE